MIGITEFYYKDLGRYKKKIIKINGEEIDGAGIRSMVLTLEGGLPARIETVVTS